MWKDVEKLYNRRTISQLQDEFPYNDWLSYFNSILPPEAQVDANETVDVGDYSFFEKLGDLFEKTSSETLANYIAWRVMKASVDYLPKAYRDREFELNKSYNGMTQPKPRWEECIAKALDLFPFALSGLYIRKHFREDAKAKALEMVMNIKSEFKAMLEKSSWMDDVTRREAITKAESIHDVIGYADGLMDDARIVQHYEKLNVTFDESLYYESVLAVIASVERGFNSKLRLPVDKKAWRSAKNPLVVNAGYSPMENAVYFPAGILQGVFFNAERPQYMNYGAIGLVIGHEITHGEIILFEDFLLMYIDAF